MFLFSYVELTHDSTKQLKKFNFFRTVRNSMVLHQNVGIKFNCLKIFVSILTLNKQL